MGCANCLHTINSILAVLGLLVIGTGVFFLIQYEWGNDLLSVPLPYLFIAVGAVVLLVNLLGCVGTGKRKKSYLFFYFVFQAILMIPEIGGGVVAILYSSNADEVIYTGWLDAALNGTLPLCSDAIEGTIENYLLIAMAVAGTTVLAQIFGLCAAVVLIRSWRSHSSESF